MPELAFLSAAAALVAWSMMYAPGRLLLHLLGLRLSRLETATLSWAAGFTFMTVLFWLLHLAGRPGLIAWYMPAGGLALAGLALRRRRLTPPAPPDRFRFDLPLLVPVLLSTLVAAAFMFPSGLDAGGTLTLVSAHAHDAPWHIFNIYQLAFRFPPELPGFSGVPMPNYHIFSDLAWAAFVRAGLDNPWFLYLRFAPVFYTVLLALSTYITVLAWLKNRPAAVLAVWLTGIASNFGYVLPLLVGPESYRHWDSVFWCSAPHSLILNPGISSSFMLVMAGMWLLVRFLDSGDKRLLPLIGLVWGALTAFKIYAAVLVLAALAVCALVRGLRREPRFALAAAAALPLNLALFIHFNKGAEKLIVFLPGFNLATMLTLPGWMGLMEPARLVDLYTRNLPLVALLMAGLALVFLVGNLGPRGAGLFQLARCCFTPFACDPVLLFVTVLSGGAFAASILFVQSGATFNTVQFFYYAVLLGALPAAFQFRNWTAGSTPGRRLAVAALLVALGLPGVVHAVFFSPMVGERYIAPREWTAGFTWLKDNSPRDAIVIRPLDESLMSDAGFAAWLQLQRRGRLRTLQDWVGFMRESNAKPGAPAQAPAPAPPLKADRPLGWGDTTLVAALSLRSVFLEDTISAQLQMPDDRLTTRMTELRGLYRSFSAPEARAFLDRNGISHVVERADIPLPFPPLDASLVPVFSNSTMIIYRTVPD
jgi:hypothetical protein